jgi:hydroxymethylglutaryl-CoA reductase (NADPH)
MRDPAPLAAGPGASDLVPRFEEQGYGADEVEARRRWVEERTGASLRHVGSCSIAGEAMRGNVENPVGAAQVPLGVAGPLLIEGEHARGTFYVPLATTEGALVRSYERGMMTLTRAGGATARVLVDENRVSPVFRFTGVAEAAAFARGLEECFAALKAEAESTTRHGRLLRLEPRPLGREVVVHFCYWTADAHGMNMIVKATDRACRWLVEQGRAGDYYIFSGAESEKRASGSLFAGGKGKKVLAGARIPARLVRAYLHTTPERLADLWQRTVLGHLQAAALGYNGHFANGLTALFIACGQDVANVANSAVGVTVFERTAEGDLYASVTLPSLTVATVGGGTGLGTAHECLEVLGCAGAGGALKLAEIAAACLLAGELSMGAAIASGEFVAAHEEYGRNRPDPHPPAPSPVPSLPPSPGEGEKKELGGAVPSLSPSPGEREKRKRGGGR